ncbi:MAG: phage integrase SAM-like domain-containing protein [Fimbriimonadaceae bacterium]|nr:phage integrase SAM-like domain-containing protein [Chitinophagales bacterium]
MATVKIVLRKKQNKDKTFPLAIRIIKDRRTSFIHLGRNLKETEWDFEKQRVKKSHPNSTRLNNFLIKKLAEATDKSLELETQRSDVSSFAVKQKIKPSGGQTFFAQAELYLENLKLAGKYNRYTADKPRVKHFRDFLKGTDISFSDITISLLERFQVYLKSVLENGERTIINHLVVIRSVFSQAIKAEIIDQKYYPFGSGKIRIQFPESSKIGLAPMELKLLEDVILKENKFENHCRNLWLFSFYLAGMRVSDVLRLKWTDIQNERLHYIMGKNSKAGSLKIPEKALRIIEQYKNQKRFKDDYIFPELKVLEKNIGPFLIQRKIAFSASRIDKFLRKNVAPQAGINKKLTMHIARHTFGNISGDKISIQMLQKLYRHSSVITTIGYQSNFIHKDADDALNAVVNF